MTLDSRGTAECESLEPVISATCSGTYTIAPSRESLLYSVLLTPHDNQHVHHLLFFFFKESGPPRDLPPSPPRPSPDLAPPRPVGGALLLLADEPVARGPQARGAMGRPRHPAGLTGNRQTGGRPERAS